MGAQEIIEAARVEIAAREVAYRKAAAIVADVLTSAEGWPSADMLGGLEAVMARQWVTENVRLVLDRQADEGWSDEETVERVRRMLRVRLVGAELPVTTSTSENERRVAQMRALQDYMSTGQFNDYR